MDSKDEVKPSNSHILNELMDQFDSSKTVKNQKAFGRISILAGELSLSCSPFLRPSPSMPFVAIQNKFHNKGVLYKSYEPSNYRIRHLRQ